MHSNNNYHRGHKKPYRICTRQKSLVIDHWEMPLVNLEELWAGSRRDLKLVQLDNDLLCLSDVYQKFGPRINTINDLLPFHHSLCTMLPSLKSSTEIGDRMLVVARNNDRRRAG